MNSHDYIELNKLSHLHNGNSIFFCKTDYIINEFETIKKNHSNQNIVLISGNSDYPITEDIIRIMPHNIKKWYAQNALANSDILEPIPIGMENKKESSRFGHGIGYHDRVTDKENIINNLPNISPNNFIYANFNVQTNPKYRTFIKNAILDIKHIDWQEANLDLKTYYTSILPYKMVLCPIGNGIDTHRLWETLYCNRIPITIKVGNYKIYEMYKKLPIIILNSIEEIRDFDHMNKLYEQIINSKYEKKLLDINYWKEKILKIS